LAGRQGRAALEALPAASRLLLAPLPYRAPSQQYLDKTDRAMREAAEELQELRRQRGREEAREQQEGQGGRGQGQGRQEQGQSQAGQQARSGGEQLAPATAAALAAAGSPAGSAGGPAPSPAAAPPPGPDEPACPYIGLNASSKFLDAQCLWDATMAYSITTALAAPHTTPHAAPAPSPVAAAAPAKPPPAAAPAAAPAPPPLVVHVCGKFHCEERLGIVEHLAEYSPQARVLVVVFEPVEGGVERSGEAWAEHNRGDFVVLSDGSLPRSFDVQHPV
jgi:hypothetical protein